MRRGAETERGYRLDWFAAHFETYLPRSLTPSQSSIPAAFDADLSITLPVSAASNVTDRETGKSGVSAPCDGVTLPETGPDDAEFGERAGILEYDGGYPRAEAERLAREKIANLRRRF